MAVWTYTLGSGYYYGHMNSSAGSNWLNVKNYLEGVGGFTNEAIIGIMANMDHESYLNPAQQEHGKGGSNQYGYGLVMWTPARSKIEAYANNDPLHRPWYDGDLQMDYLLVSAPATWQESTSYPYTWEEFKQITDYNLATRVFFYNFERGTWHDELDTYTSYWANVCYGDTPSPPPDPPHPDPQEDDEMLYTIIQIHRKREKYII